MKELQMTGERMVTSFNNHFGKYEHLHRYALAIEFVKNKTVLDIACGEGYGTNILSETANQITGVDISEETIKHASEKYSKKNIIFKTGSAADIPCENDQFDVVVSFETIEHHSQHEKMFREIKRVLRSDGVFIISSPEKGIYQLRDPENVFHVKELTLNELLTLVNAHFKFHIVLKQIIAVGSIILPVDDIKTKIATYDGDFYSINRKFEEYEFFNRPFFNIILCSDIKIDPTILPLASIYNAYPVYNSSLNEKENYFNEEIQKFESSKLYRIFKKIRAVKYRLFQFFK